MKNTAAFGVIMKISKTLSLSSNTFNLVKKEKVECKYINQVRNQISNSKEWQTVLSSIAQEN